MNKNLLKFLDRALRSIVRWMPKNKTIPADPKRILIIKLAAMGDAFCLMPAIIKIRLSSPHSQIDWLTTKRTNPWVFKRIDAINNIIILPIEPIKLIGFLFSYFFRRPVYDLIIDYDQYYAISEIMAYKGKSSSGFKTPLKGHTFSESYVYDSIKSEKNQFMDLALMSFSGINNDINGDFYELKDLIREYSPSDFLLDFSRKSKLSDYPLVVIYPGSSLNAMMRRWPPNRYLSLAQILSKKCIVIIAGGPDEMDISEFFLTGNQRIQNFIGKLAIEEWLWFFRYNVDLFIGNDGGMMHLAESQGLPSVSLFGPALGSKWGSLNKKSIILDVELNCRPCIKTYLGIIPQTCSRGDFACMNNISVNMVIDAVEKILTVDFCR